MSPIETVRSHHPSTSSGSVMASCGWIKADEFCVTWYLFDVSFNFLFMDLPFKCPFMSVVRQGGKHRFPNLATMCCWDRGRFQTKLVFSWFVCLKNVIFVSECLEDTSLVKNGSNMYLSHDGVKELVIICDHVHFCYRNEMTQTASSLLKGRSCGKTHVTLIQEMNGQWDVSLSSNCLLFTSKWPWLTAA